MRVSLITTATIPWFTGPAISSIERIYAIQREGHETILYTPWIEPEIQRYIFPKGLEFATKDEHLSYLQSYLSKNNRKLEVKFYDANWEKNCLLPATSLNKFIEPCDVLILEEAEHILWNQLFYGRLKQAKYVIGIIQTNYQERGKYAASLFNLKIQVFLAILPYYNAWICERNCDCVVSISRSIVYAGPLHVALVNGVRDSFLQPQTQLENHRFEKDFYYLGSVAWEKNLKQLIHFCQSCQVAIDIYGSGTNYGRGSTMEQIIAYSRQHGNYLNFRGSTAEPYKTVKLYKTYISCSVSDKSCGATNEAIAMGKFVIIPRHPSNEFFYRYENVLLFENEREFAGCIQHTLTHNPVPLSPSELEQFSWKKATRLLLSKFMSLNIDE